jgi:hypothetical protein
MKAKVTRGTGFRGALQYVFDVGPRATGAKEPEMVAGTMAGLDPVDLAKEFSLVRQRRPDIARPIAAIRKRAKVRRG